MPKLIMHPIGSILNQNDPLFLQNKQQILLLEKNLFEKRKEISQGWGAEYQARVKNKNKLTAHQRIELLADSKEDILPLNTFVNHEREFFDGKETKKSPNAGVITCLVKVHDKWVIVVANDNTVASGSWWPNTPEKIIRAQEIALKVRIPVVYLVDCSGLFLPEQGHTFPGKKGAGHIFKMNSLLSSNGVPQIAGVCGDCIAGGGYMPIISDKVIMTENAYMVIAGAALISKAKGQTISSHDIGGASIHVHISNCADERVPNDETMIEKIKQEITMLPSSATNYYRNGFTPSKPKLDEEDLLGILPCSKKQSYVIEEVLARLVDDSLFYEYDSEKGKEVICGLARVNGLLIGFLANRQGLLEHPDNKNKKRPGGILYKEGVSKLSRFARILNEDGIPAVWLQDVSGFDVGKEAEMQGLLSYGSSLIYANSTALAPMMTLLLRKASGAGYYAMAGAPYDPLFQLSCVLSRLSVMEGETLARGAYNTKLDENFNIIAQNEKEKEQIAQGMKAIEDKIEKDMDPYKAASQMDTDEIISLLEIRKYLSCFAEISYQSTGYRKIKNSRILSLFDYLND